jgi:FkbM family methyltransferase
MPEPFVSYAQNGEDVVLWRALSHVENGRYVEIGANDPVELSISKAFADRGWSGIEVEPIPALADLLRTARPDDEVVEVAVTDAEVDHLDFHLVNATGLSTLEAEVAAKHQARGWQVETIRVPTMRLDALLDEYLLPDDDIHFMMVDVEGGEAAVLRSGDWARWRPWVLVVEATTPIDLEPCHQEWEPHLLAHDYEFCLFDGLSRFYVAAEHAADLKAKLSVPALHFDASWISREVFELRRRVEDLLDVAETRHTELVDELAYWRGLALSDWITAVAARGEIAGTHNADAAALQALVAEMERSLSWRITEPLRTVRRAQLNRGRGL